MTINDNDAVTVRAPIEVGILRRRDFDQAVMIAAEMGLRPAVDWLGGWISRRGIVHLTGSARTVSRWLDYLAVAGFDVDRGTVANIYEEIREAVGDQIWDAVRDQVRSDVRAAVSSDVRAAVNWRQS